MVPKISIITATRNALGELPALARSILCQPEGLVEWIVIDSASSDGTVEFLQQLDDPKLSWISEPDEGIYDAWNKGVSRAHGQWVMFLGADDRLGEGWLDACAAAPDVDLIYGDLAISDAKGELLTRVEAESWENVKRDIKIRMMLPHPGLAHNRELFRTRRFDTSFKIAGDFNFLAGADIRSAVRLPVAQAVMRLGGVSNHPGKVGLTYRENLRVVRQHGLVLPLVDRANWLVKRSLAALAPQIFLALQDLRWRLRQRL